MSRKKTLILVSFVVLLLTVPWFFTAKETPLIFGFPCWAFYSLTMTVIYVVVHIVFIECFWDIFEGAES